MRICHVITRLIVGGAQENTLLTCRGLRERGHAVLLITGPDAGPEGSLLDEAHSGGYEVVVEPAMRRAVRPASDWLCRRRLTRRFREWRPDVVHTHSSKAGILGRLAARQAGVPHVVHTIHGLSFNRTQPRLLRRLYEALERRCARFTDRIICVADAMSAQSLAAGVGRPEQYVTIRSGMCTEWFDPARRGDSDRAAVRREWGIDDGCIAVGTVARLYGGKGYGSLIPAITQAARRDPRLRFIWVGDGAGRDRYVSQLERLAIRDRVVLTGLVSPKTIPALLAGMDLLVHASRWEGLARVAVQALLMERPVIAFDIDGAPEVVLHGRTGVLVPLDDTDGLADAILHLAADPERRLAYGRAGRQQCLTEFDHHRMIDRIAEVYATLSTR